MKRIQIAFAALLFSASVLIAQPDTKNHERHSSFQHKEMAYNKLNLSEDQKAKLKVVDEDFNKQIQTLNRNDDQTVKQQRDAREALIKAHKAQIESVLTPDQKTQLANMKMGNNNHHGEMTAKHFDKIKQELVLTDQQVSQLKNSQEAMNSKMEIIQSNTSLDQTMKKQQLRSLQEDMQKNIEQILTPEQNEKWQTMRQNRMHLNHKRSNFRSAKPQPQV